MTLIRHVLHVILALAAWRAAGAVSTCAKRDGLEDTTSMLQADLLVNKRAQTTLDLTAKSRSIQSSTDEGYNSSHMVKQRASLMESSNLERTGLMNEIGCIGNTGGTCLVESCAPWRGKTDCDVGRCFCAKGYCANVQGKCIKKQNELLGSNIRFRNARYPHHYMYISSIGIVHSGVYVDNEENYQNNFSVYRPPGQGNVAGHPVELLLASDKYKDYVATIAYHVSSHAHEPSTDVYRTHAVPINVIGVSKPVDDLVVHLYKAPPYKGAPNGSQSVIIESYRYRDRLFSVGDFSWGVQASDGDQGAGSYWLVEPPLNLTLTEYRGPLCSFDCGHYGSGRSKTSSVVLIVIISAVSLVCACGLFAAAFYGLQHSGAFGDGEQ